MEWSNEMVMTFLDAYGDEPIVWDAWHPSNRKRDEVAEAWKRIQDKMGGNLSVDELKKKKDSLMASYRVVARRTKTIAESGEGEGYKPTWFAYEKMASFLSGRKGRRAAWKPKGSVHKVSHYASDDCIDVTEEPINIIIEQVASGHIPEEFLPSTPQEDTERRSVQKRKISDANEEDIREQKEAFYSSLKNTKEKEKRDYCDKYGDIVASRLRQLDEWHRDLAINKIDNILYEEKRKYLGRLRNHSSADNHTRE